MDIKSLLSPQHDDPIAPPPPTTKSPAKKGRKPKVAKPSNEPSAVAGQVSTNRQGSIAQNGFQTQPKPGVQNHASSDRPTEHGPVSTIYPTAQGGKAELFRTPGSQVPLSANSPISNDQKAKPRRITQSEAKSRLRASTLHHEESLTRANAPQQLRSEYMSPADLEVADSVNAALFQNPLDFEAHAKLVDQLHKGFTQYWEKIALAPQTPVAPPFDLMQDLRRARESMHALFSLGEQRWLDWIDDLDHVKRNFEDAVVLRELFEKALSEEPASVSIWRRYGTWMSTEYRKSKITGKPSEQTDPPDESSALAAEFFSHEQTLGVWRRGAEQTLWNMVEGQSLWLGYTDLLLADMGSTPDAQGVTQVIQWFMARLQIPHATWDETSQRLSTFLSTHDNARWESTMIAANTAGQEAKKSYEFRDLRETALSQAMVSGDRGLELQLFKDYIDYETGLRRKKRGFNANLTSALFERAVIRFPDHTDLWESYIMFLSHEVNQAGHRDLPILSTLDRATRHCPTSGKLWAQYLLEAEIAQVPFSDISDLKHKATSTGLLDLGEMGEVLKVTSAWCGFLRRRAFVQTSSDEDMDVAEVGIRSAIEDLETTGRKKYGKAYQGDPEYRLEKIYIKYLTQCRNWEGARDTFKKLIKTRGHSYDFWLRYYLWEMSTWSKLTYQDTDPDSGRYIRPLEATAVLQQAIRRPDVDWPEKLLETYLYHCEDHEDALHLQAGITEYQEQNKMIAARRQREAYEQAQRYQEESSVVQFDQTIEGSSTVQQIASEGAGQAVALSNGDSADGRNKRKRDDQPIATSPKRTRAAVPSDEAPSETKHEMAQILKRDRENATITVRNLPLHCTESRVRQYFRECGKINSLRMTKAEDGNSQMATIEFETHEDLLSAQTKDMKVLDDRPIQIAMCSGTILYVCNFPREADEQWLRDMFGKYGEILDVRLPSLKYNNHRRFAYIQYSTASQAEAALILHGRELAEELQLSVKLSNPSKKQDRHGALSEGRELFVANVPWGIEWKDLKQHFSQFGSVESARLPRKVDGSTKGIGYVVFRHREDASKALALHLTQWKGRLINVSMSTNDKSKRQAQIVTNETLRDSQSPHQHQHQYEHEQSSLSEKGSKGRESSAQGAAKKDEIQARTIALMNVPDTVNDGRIRALAEPFGELVQVLLRPDREGVILEYKDQSSVGKASLALEGHMIAPDRQIRIGTVNDLKATRAIGREGDKTVSSKNESKPLLPPSIIRRPGQGVGRRGGKGGLGLKGAGVGWRSDRALTSATTTAPPSDPTQNGKTAESVPTPADQNGDGKLQENDNQANGKEREVRPKSNADFKAMMLNS